MNQISPVSRTETSLSSIRSGQQALERRNQELSSGRKARDDGNDKAYVLAKSLSDKLSDLAAVTKDAGTSLGAIEAGTNGLNAISGLLSQMKATASQALSETNPAKLSGLKTQYDELARQIDAVTEDASFESAKLLSSSGTELKAPSVEDARRGNRSVALKGASAGSAALGTPSAGDWAGGADPSADIAAVEKAQENIRTRAAELTAGTQAFTSWQSSARGQSEILARNADSLISADSTRSSAEAAALRNYQKIGRIALANSAQTQEAVLSLFSSGKN
jgi:flagellin-like hook-associated protein FlgL